MPIDCWPTVRLSPRVKSLGFKDVRICFECAISYPILWMCCSLQFDYMTLKDRSYLYVNTHTHARTVWTELKVCDVNTEHSLFAVPGKVNHKYMANLKMAA